MELVSDLSLENVDIKLTNMKDVFSKASYLKTQEQKTRKGILILSFRNHVANPVPSLKLQK